MMAADLPEARHPSPTAMARALVTYMADPNAVRQAVLREFQSAPWLCEIRLMRRDHERRQSRPDPHPYRTNDGINPMEAVAAEFNSTSFLAALMREHPERFAVAAE